MPKIIFKRLTVKEEKRVIAGNDASIVISTSNIQGCSPDIDKFSVGSGCLVTMLTIKKLCRGEGRRWGA